MRGNTSSVNFVDTFLASARSHCGSNTPRVLFTTTVTLRYPLEKAIVGVVISLILKKYEAKAYLKSLLQREKGDRSRWMRCKNQITPTKKGDHWSPLLLILLPITFALAKISLAKQISLANRRISPRLCLDFIASRRKVNLPVGTGVPDGPRIINNHNQKW